MTRRVRHSLATTLERLLPFQDRLGLHLAVLTLVASAVLIGGRMYAPAPPSQQGVAGIAIGKSLVPVPESLAVVAYAPIAAPSPAVSAPSGSAPAASPKGQDETRPDALPRPNQVAALSIQETIQGVPDFPLVTQGEGVMVMRAMPSSRGGDRAPAPSASPTTIPPAPTPVPPSPAPAPVKQAMKVQTYKVQEGDTLLAIAARFGITPETVLWANNLGNGEL
ncbi:MAG: LysM peptidoglycan-binding domain-containing protein, partial [Chloroflexi bacterium]|nr:LysM peptidoglycan-binding domain-containing protein [Chloroflexota bacterium]